MRVIFEKFITNPALRNSFGENFCKNLRLLNTYQEDPMRVSYKYVVQPQNVNILGTMHGGAICTLVDVTTTISTIKSSPIRNVSVSLSTEFLLPVKANQQLRVENIVKKTGKTLIFSECEIFNQEDKLIAKGSHIKAFVRGSWDFLDLTV